VAPGSYTQLWPNINCSEYMLCIAVVTARLLELVQSSLAKVVVRVKIKVKLGYIIVRSKA